MAPLKWAIVSSGNWLSPVLHHTINGTIANKGSSRKKVSEFLIKNRNLYLRKRIWKRHLQNVTHVVQDVIWSKFHVDACVKLQGGICQGSITVTSHERCGVSYHHQLDCLFNSFFGLASTPALAHKRPIRRKAFACYIFFMSYLQPASLAFILTLINQIGQDSGRGQINGTTHSLQHSTASV